MIKDKSLILSQKKFKVKLIVNHWKYSLIVKQFNRFQSKHWKYWLIVELEVKKMKKNHAAFLSYLYFE